MREKEREREGERGREGEGERAFGGHWRAAKLDAPLPSLVELGASGGGGEGEGEGAIGGLRRASSGAMSLLC